MKDFFTRMILLCIFLGAPCAALAYSQQVVVITPVPAPRELAVVPGGYEKCYLVESGWYNGRWVPTHRACRYHQRNHYYHRNTWVDGHWRCDRYDRYSGACRVWFWVPSHWVR